MSKKVKGEVSDGKKVKGDIHIVESEIHLLVYQSSDTEERILSSYTHKEDILFLMQEFLHSDKDTVRSFGGGKNRKKPRKTRKFKKTNCKKPRKTRKFKKKRRRRTKKHKLK